MGLLAACSGEASPAAHETADEAALAVDDKTASSMSALSAKETTAANSVETLSADKATAVSDAKQPTTVASLPLKRGFYVSSGTSCGQASNATLVLVGRDGINTSRVPCKFEKIEKTGANLYRVTDRCVEGGPAWGTEEQISINVTTYEIKGKTAFTSKSDNGWENSAQYCSPSSLPEPWRSNDISDSM